MAILTDLDKQLAELQERHPGWRIWFVPHLGGQVVWCGQREPLLNTDSAEHLSAAIRDVEADRREAQP